MMAAEYSIIFDIPKIWYPHDRETILLAAQIVDHALYPFTDDFEGESFNKIIGLTHVRYNNGLTNWAHSSGDKIIFQRYKVLLPLIVHEFGHTFDRRAKLAPSKQFRIDKIDPAAGSLWGGMHPPKLKGYDENEGFANLFADYCMQMLRQNPAGDALRAWFAAHMGAWVATARAQR